MHIVALIIAVISVIIDQLIKYGCVGLFGITLDQLNAEIVNSVKVEDIELIPGLYSLTFVPNFNGALGMFANLKWVLVIFTVIALAILVYIVLKKKFNSKLFYISSGLIIGGGIGNLIDRIFLGYVIDNLSISFFPPVCNFADYCVTVGAVLLAIFILFCYKPDSKEKENSNE